MQCKLSKKCTKNAVLAGLLILIMLTAFPFIINQLVIKNTASAIIGEMRQEKEVSFLNEGQASFVNLNADCILVLGAGLKPDGTPNHMLEDRLEAALTLYKEGAAPKLLLTGDHGQDEYDEVNAMKNYMLDHEVPEEDIFLDHAGFSTYDSMYRAKAIFEVNTVIVAGIFVSFSPGTRTFLRLYGSRSLLI